MEKIVCRFCGKVFSRRHNCKVAGRMIYGSDMQTPQMRGLQRVRVYSGWNYENRENQTEEAK